MLYFDDSHKKACTAVALFFVSIAILAGTGTGVYFLVKNSLPANSEASSTIADPTVELTFDLKKLTISPGGTAHIYLKLYCMRSIDGDFDSTFYVKAPITIDWGDGYINKIISDIPNNYEFCPDHRYPVDENPETTEDLKKVVISSPDLFACDLSDPSNPYYDNVSLVSAKFKNIKCIRSSAFTGCTNLKKVEFSDDSVFTPFIEDHAFFGCSSLESFDICGPMVLGYKDLSYSKNSQRKKDDIGGIFSGCSSYTFTFDNTFATHYIPDNVGTDFDQNYTYADFVPTPTEPYDIYYYDYYYYTIRHDYPRSLLSSRLFKLDDGLKDVVLDFTKLNYGYELPIVSGIECVDGCFDSTTVNITNIYVRNDEMKQEVISRWPTYASKVSIKTSE